MRLLIRPTEDGRITIELLEYAFATKPGTEIKLYKNAIVAEYEIDDKLFAGYNDHVNRISQEGM